MKKHALLILIPIALIVCFFAFYKLEFIQDLVHPKSQPAQMTGNTADLVTFSIKPGDTVSGKMSAEGTISGSYFFEGNIVVDILDSDKNIVKVGSGTATTDWTTDGPVTFTTTLDFTWVDGDTAYIRIKNDNESGDPARDKFIDIPVVLE